MPLFAGQKLRVSDLTGQAGGSGGAGGSVFANADVIVNNSTSFVDITGLSVAVIANATYEFRGKVFYSSGTAPDFKIQPSSPAGTTGKWAMLGYGRDVSPAIDVGAGSQWMAADIGTSLTVAGDTVGTTLLCCLVEGHFVTTTAGTFKLRFAQRSATVANTIARANSTLTVVRQA